jgi:hypothetical protein
MFLHLVGVTRAAGIAVAILAGLWATPSAAKVFTWTLHVKIDTVGNTAYIYDGDFKRYPDSPNDSWTSIVRFPDKRWWLLGVNADVVERLRKGKVRVVSHRPAYHEMVHHFVLTYESPHRPVTDDCTNRPIAAGSELSDFTLPAGFAYSMHGGALRAISELSRHWANTFNVPAEKDVYLRFILTFDDEGALYQDTNVTWVGFPGVGSGVRCDEELAVPPGPSEWKGPPVTAAADMRIVAVVTHLHDHAVSLDLLKNDQSLRRFVPDNARVWLAHALKEPAIVPMHEHGPIHAHKDGGHLPPQGLDDWALGRWGPSVAKGDELRVVARYNNPHHHAIDNMGIALVFWAPLRPQTTVADQTPPEAVID